MQKAARIQLYIKCLPVFLAVLVLFASPPANAEGINPRPLTREQERISKIFFARKFDELERLARRFRTEETKVSDGQPSLSTIYSAVSDCGCDHVVPEQMWKLRKKLLDQWLTKFPRSAAAKVAIGYYYEAYASDARGNGYANTVTPEGWRLFSARLAKARRHLESLDAAARNDPGYYEVMLRIARDQGWPKEETEALFQSAIKAQPNYLPVYFARSVFFQERWGGSRKEMVEFIDRTSDTARPWLGTRFIPVSGGSTVTALTTLI